MIYILDTDAFTLAELPGSAESLRLHARALQVDKADKLVTTIVTYEEQTRGWLAFAAKSRASAHQVKAYNRLKRHLLAYRAIEVLDFDAAAAAEFDRLCVLKIRIGSPDLKIAAIAFAQDATVVTRNLKDFSKVPGLRVEDWTK